MHRVPARKEHFNLIISTISEVGVKKCLRRLIIKILLEERGKNTWRHRVEQIVSIVLYPEESVYSKYLEEAGSYFRLPNSPQGVSPFPAVPGYFVGQRTASNTGLSTRQSCSDNIASIFERIKADRIYETR